MMMKSIPVKTHGCPISLYFVTGLLCCVFLFYGTAPQASPTQKSATKQNQSLSASSLQSYYWYDGQQKRKVWLNPILVAEFRQDTWDDGLIRNRFPAARLWKRLPGMRIFRVGTESPEDVLLSQGVISAQVRSRLSPVFQNTPAVEGGLRSLPGNVIVYLNPKWGREQVEHWLEQGGYEAVKRLDVRPNAYILKTEPGIEALKLANRLYESGGVVAAFPDWWLEGTTR